MSETDPQQEFANILGKVEGYLEHLKEEGAQSVEVDPKNVTKLGEPMAKSATPAEAAPEVSTPAPTKSEDTGASAGMSEVAARIATCTNCPLHENRTNTVPGQGSTQPEIAFIGEGPGADEDAQGIAFIGRSGQLLTRIIARMGFARDDVFIGNIVKCRPPGNRTPFPDEMDTCMPFLKEQLALLQPKVIVCLGATAVKGLLKTKTGITKLRGTWMQFEGIDVMPTYHPSYLLRSGGDEKGRYWEVWEDMVKVLEQLGREPPPKK